MTARLAIAAALLLAASSTVGAATANAATAGDDAEAHYKKGRSLYNVSEYRAALDEFKRAYVEHADPALLYNIAQCHRQLGNNREAVTFYKRFLNESPRAPNRTEIETLIGELDAKAGPAKGPEARPADTKVNAAPPREPAGPVTPPPPAPPEAAPAGIERAGLHLELGVGIGGLHDDFTWLGLTKSTASGASGAFQLAVTFGVLPRLALGVFAAGESVQSPRVQTGGVTNDNISVGFVGFLGVVADWRLAPRPAGWHFEAALGGARMTIKDNTGAVASAAPVGGAFVLAAGYDWALTPAWQLGVLARFLGASLSDQNVTHDVVALSALAVLSYR